MFTGVNPINIDTKGRMAMPTKYRDRLLDQCAGKMVITVDVDSPVLFVYPYTEWLRVAEEVGQLPTYEPGVLNFQRKFIGFAAEVEFDGSGRILIPAPLREYAGIDKKVVLVGQLRKFELWDEARWTGLSEDTTEVPEAARNLIL